MDVKEYVRNLHLEFSGKLNIDPSRCPVIAIQFNSQIHKTNEILADENGFFNHEHPISFEISNVRNTLKLFRQPLHFKFFYLKPPKEELLKDSELLLKVEKKSSRKKSVSSKGRSSSRKNKKKGGKGDGGVMKESKSFEEFVKANEKCEEIHAKSESFEFSLAEVLRGRELLVKKFEGEMGLKVKAQMENLWNNEALGKINFVRVTMKKLKDLPNEESLATKCKKIFFTFKFLEKTERSRNDYEHMRTVKCGKNEVFDFEITDVKECRKFFENGSIEVEVYDRYPLPVQRKDEDDDDDDDGEEKKILVNYGKAKFHLNEIGELRKLKTIVKIKNCTMMKEIERVENLMEGKSKSNKSSRKKKKRRKTKKSTKRDVLFSPMSPGTPVGSGAVFHIPQSPVRQGKYFRSRSRVEMEVQMAFPFPELDEFNKVGCLIVVFEMDYYWLLNGIVEFLDSFEKNKKMVKKMVQREVSPSKESSRKKKKIIEEEKEVEEDIEDDILGGFMLCDGEKRILVMEGLVCYGLKDLYELVKETISYRKLAHLEEEKLKKIGKEEEEGEGEGEFDSDEEDEEDEEEEIVEIIYDPNIFYSSRKYPLPKEEEKLEKRSKKKGIGKTPVTPVVPTRVMSPFSPVPTNELGKTNFFLIRHRLANTILEIKELEKQDSLEKLMKKIEHLITSDRISEVLNNRLLPTVEELEAVGKYSKNELIEKDVKDFQMNLNLKEQRKMQEREERKTLKLKTIEEEKLRKIQELERLENEELYLEKYEDLQRCYTRTVNIDRVVIIKFPPIKYKCDPKYVYIEGERERYVERIEKNPISKIDLQELKMWGFIPCIKEYVILCFPPKEYRENERVNFVKFGHDVIFGLAYRMKATIFRAEGVERMHGLVVQECEKKNLKKMSVSRYVKKYDWEFKPKPLKINYYKDLEINSRATKLFRKGKFREALELFNEVGFKDGGVIKKMNRCKKLLENDRKFIREIKKIEERRNEEKTIKKLVRKGVLERTKKEKVTNFRKRPPYRQNKYGKSVDHIHPKGMDLEKEHNPFFDKAYFEKYLQHNCDSTYTGNKDFDSRPSRGHVYFSEYKKEKKRTKDLKIETRNMLESELDVWKKKVVVKDINFHVYKSKEKGNFQRMPILKDPPKLAHLNHHPVEEIGSIFADEEYVDPHKRFDLFKAKDFVVKETFKIKKRRHFLHTRKIKPLTDLEKKNRRLFKHVENEN